MTSSPEADTQRPAWWRRLLTRAQGPLMDRRARWFVPLLGVLLASPSLFNGLNTDDHFAAVALTGAEPPLARRAWDLFALVPAPEAGVQEMMDLGVLPWWTPLESKITALRPLASLTHAFDYNILGHHPWLMHLQNLCWYGALIFLVGLLHQSVFAHGDRAGVSPMGHAPAQAEGPLTVWPAWIAVLATLFYALDDAHGMAVGWTANRNAVMGATFSVGALLSHHKWRALGWTPGVALAPALFLAALASSEVSFTVLAYALSYEIFLGKGGWRGKSAALAPWFLLAGVWRGVLWGLGYTNNGAGLFMDPFDAPLTFLMEAPSRVSALVFGQWGWVPSDFWVAVPEGEGHAAVIVGALVFAALIAVVYWPIARHDRAARFWAVGALGALVPLGATFPMDRLLLWVGVGASAMIALVIGAVYERLETLPQSPRWQRRARLLTASWLIIHGALAPMLLMPRSMTSALLSDSFVRLSDHLGAGEGLEDQTLVVLLAPDFLSAAMTPVVRRSRGETAPDKVRVLAAGFEPAAVKRTGARKIQVERASGMYTDPMETLFYGPHRSMGVGQQRRLDGLVVTILAVRLEDGRPSLVEYEFERTLDDPGFRVVTWKRDRYVDVPLLKVGESVELEGMQIEAIFAPPQ